MDESELQDPAPDRRRVSKGVIVVLALIVLVAGGLVLAKVLHKDKPLKTYASKDSSVTPPLDWTVSQPGAGYDTALIGPGGAIFALHEADNTDHITAASLKAGVEAGTIKEPRLTGAPLTIVTTPGGPGVQIQRKAPSGFLVTTVVIPTTHHIYIVLEGPGHDAKAIEEMPKVFASLRLNG